MKTKISDFVDNVFDKSLQVVVWIFYAAAVITLSPLLLLVWQIGGFDDK